jgi:small subunit ribosomal protein S15e
MADADYNAEEAAGTNPRAGFGMDAPQSDALPWPMADPLTRAPQEAHLPQVQLPRHRPGPVGRPLGQESAAHTTRLLDLSSEQLRDIVHARARRRFNRGLKRKPMGLIKKLRKAKQEAKANEKPDTVRTHLRDMIVVPEMIGSIIGVYSGKDFNQVEVKPEMVGHYLGEFSIT